MHCDQRMEKCRRSFFAMKDLGLSYPGADCNVKSYLWKSLCQPVLMYGSDCISISKSKVKEMESLQGKLLKSCLGFDKRCRSTPLLEALNVSRISDCIMFSNASLMKRIMFVDSPINRLTCYLLSLYITKGTIIPNTLIHRLVTFGLSPTKCISTSPHPPSHTFSGCTDSLRFLLMHEHFIKPYSDEHILSCLLLRSF